MSLYEAVVSIVCAVVLLAIGFGAGFINGCDFTKKDFIEIIKTMHRDTKK